jgi:hypothetical protein
MYIYKYIQSLEKDYRFTYSLKEADKTTDDIMNTELPLIHLDMNQVN